MLSRWLVVHRLADESRTLGVTGTLSPTCNDAGNYSLRVTASFPLLHIEMTESTNSDMNIEKKNATVQIHLLLFIDIQFETQYLCLLVENCQ